MYIPRFPRWRRLLRIFYETEDALQSLPMLLITPTVAALFGSAWAASHPSTAVIRNSGVVTVPPSFSDVLLSSVVAGGARVVVVIVLVGGWTFIQYLYLGGEKDWQAGVNLDYADLDHPTVFFYLAPEKTWAPIDLRDLREVEYAVKHPNGEFRLHPNARLVEDQGTRSGPERLFMGLSLGGPPPYNQTSAPGRYEVRWYAVAGHSRMYELVRAIAEVKADGTYRMVLNRYQRLLDWLNNL